MTFNYDVIVVGAGHAGCEAAAAAANLGSKTLLITMDMNKIAQMSCNPAVGGIAKGQIVRHVEPACPKRPCPFYRLLAGHTGEYAESIHLAGYGSRTDYRAWTSLRRPYGNECRIPCRSGGAYERDLPKRPASYRKNPDTGRTYRRACGDRTYRATCLFRYPNRSHENRNTGPYRWPERSLR